MNTQNNGNLGRTLKNDIKSGGHYKTLKKELHGINEFFLNSDKRLRLSGMNRFKRFFVRLWWVFKEMILRLTPFRRIIFVLGILFLFSSGLSITIGSNTKINQTDRGFIGGVLITFVLILELKDKLIAREELLAGKRIQESLMPEVSPAVDGWDLWLFTKPANEVCGDLIDFIDVDMERKAVVIADVAGKGLNAALITAKLQASIRALINDYGLVDLTSKINRIFHKENLREMFASMLIAEFNSGSGKIKYINAGHIPPCIIGRDEITCLGKGDTALGLLKDFSYNLNEIELSAGEMLFVYSDGATDTRNSKGEFLEPERLKSILYNCRGRSALTSGEYILSEIEKFKGEAYSSDDLSLVLLRKN
jgi:hypothetical protein